MFPIFFLIRFRIFNISADFDAGIGRYRLANGWWGIMCGRLERNVHSTVYWRQRVVCGARGQEI